MITISHVFISSVGKGVWTGVYHDLSPPQRPSTVALGRNARRLGRGKI